jgi:capsular polysaccharide biosynthesis protein
VIELPHLEPHCLDRGTHRVEIPEERLIRAKGVTVVEGGIVVRGEDLLVVEPAADPALGFVAGVWDHLIGGPKRLNEALVLRADTSRISAERAVLLTTRVPSNYFHVLIENTARMVSIAGDPRFAGVPVIVSSATPPSGIAAIERCLPGRELIMTNPGLSVEVGELLSPSFHTHPWDNTLIPWYKGACLSPRHIGFLRDCILPHRGLIETPELVYVSRKSGDARSLLNGQRVRWVMESLGFSVIDPGDLTLDEQVSIFNGAKVIVGVGGAAMSNLAFASPGARVVGLMSEQLGSFCLWSNLAHIVGAKMTYLCGPSAISPYSVEYRRNFFHAPFSIDTRTLEAVVRRVVGEAGL